MEECSTWSSKSNRYTALVGYALTMTRPRHSELLDTADCSACRLFVAADRKRTKRVRDVNYRSRAKRAYMSRESV